MEWYFCLIASFWVLFKVDCLLKGSPRHSRGFPFLPNFIQKTHFATKICHLPQNSPKNCGKANPHK